MEWGQLMQERTLFMAAPGLHAFACIGMNNAHNKSQTTVASNQVHRMYEDVENVGMRPVADCKY